MFGITDFGTYVPRARLERSAIGAALGVAAGKGTRAVASYDEDTTSLGVEAARQVVRGRTDVERLVFATTQPAYLDKTNATAVHAALCLSPAAAAYDMVGSVRSAVGALRAALDAAAGGRTALAVLSELRTGLPGSADEAQGGDGAAAFVCGADGVVAELLGTGSATAEFLDRWRVVGEAGSRLWEDRFGETAYGPLVEAAVADACKEAGIAIGDVDHLVVGGLHARANRQAVASLGVPASAVADDLTAVIGNLGCAQLGVLLADALDRAEPGRIVLAVSVADGADALVFRTTEFLPTARADRVPLRDAIATGTATVDYPTFLTWREVLRREPPRRPDPERPAAPPSRRSERWKFGFTASRCVRCDTRHLPPNRVCVSCGAIDEMGDEVLADVPATIVTFTIDRLAYSLSPPVVAAVVNFDGGGRYQCELTDVDPASVAIGDRVEMTFRRIYTSNSVHNYFWKARPLWAGRGGKG